VGDGGFGPVAPAVWEIEVSGLKVVQSWLGYRMKKRPGKKSSPFDDTRPERWTARMSDAFLELLWALGSTLVMESTKSWPVLASRPRTADAQAGGAQGSWIGQRHWGAARIDGRRRR